MNRSLILIVLAFATGLSAVPKTSEPAQKSASGHDHRAPAFIGSALKRHGCKLPKVGSRVYIVSGQFGDAKQLDWAALCLTSDGVVRVLVFWATAAPCSATIQKGWPLQRRVSPVESLDMYIQAQSQRQMLAYRTFFGDNQTVPVTHKGIEVGDEHASLIYYCHGGQWLELQGAD